MSKMIKQTAHFIAYLSIRLIATLFSFLPYRMIHSIGAQLGHLFYYLIPKFRKRALSNLSLAHALSLSIKDKKRIAKASFGNLLITCLEYGKLQRDPHLNRRLICENPTETEALIQNQQGVIFFCAHQANWEALFLEGTQRMPGVAVGNTLKNPFLTRWINQIRERFGGKILSPRQAIKGGIKALKEGKFLGLVADQALPSGGYYSSFLGTRASTSPLPAILSYKTNSPLVFASIERKAGYYYIHYSNAIWPDKSRSLKEETDRLMGIMLSFLETSIQKNPEQWMWQHNKWKQETAENVYYPFRYETILIILPKLKENCSFFLPLLSHFERIYPRAFLELFVPQDLNLPPFRGQIARYSSTKELFRKDLMTKLVFNFSGIPELKGHYLKQSALKVLDYQQLQKLAYQNQGIQTNDPCHTLIGAICRPEYFPKSGVTLCPI